MNSGRERVERRLAAVLTADIAAYSPLMGADEDGTLVALKAIRRSWPIPRSQSIVAQPADGLPVVSSACFRRSRSEPFAGLFRRSPRSDILRSCRTVAAIGFRVERSS
jgi:hypothetical protein